MGRKKYLNKNENDNINKINYFAKIIVEDHNMEIDEKNKYECVAKDGYLHIKKNGK